MYQTVDRRNLSENSPQTLKEKQGSKRPSLSHSWGTQSSYHYSLGQTPNKTYTIISNISLQEKYFPWNLVDVDLVKYTSCRQASRPLMHWVCDTVMSTFQLEGLSEKGFLFLMPGNECCGVEWTWRWVSVQLALAAEQLGSINSSPWDLKTQVFKGIHHCQYPQDYQKCFSPLFASNK